MGTLWQDVRYGFRTLVKRPGFTVVVVLSLALGIGGTTTVFSLINAVLLRPLPYRNPDRLVYLWEQSPQHGNNRVSAPTFLDWQQQGQAFEQMALIQEAGLTLTDVDQPERIEVGRVSAGFFDLLGVSATVGRTLQPPDDRLGAAPVAVLKQGLRLVALGLGLGLAGALAISRLLQGILFGVPTLSVASILGVCLLLLVVAFGACYFPARRAARIDPMTALRYE